MLSDLSLIWNTTFEPYLNTAESGNYTAILWTDEENGIGIHIL